jgi:FMN phosphatase YigB (HAD superfamily)
MSIRGVLIEDYDDPVYHTMAHGVRSSFQKEAEKLPFFVFLDSSIVHFKPWYQIAFDPKAKNGWRAILEKYWQSEPYRKLNDVVSGDPLLAKYATINFLEALFKGAADAQAQKGESGENHSWIKYYRFEDEDESGLYNFPKGFPEGYLMRREIIIPLVSTRDAKKDREKAIAFLTNLIDRQLPDNKQLGLLSKLFDRSKQKPSPGVRPEESINAICKSLEWAAQLTLKDVEAAESFSRAGIPIAKLLEKPDEFRRKMRNTIVVQFVDLFHRLSRESSGLGGTVPTPIGGRPLGVKRIQRWSELPRVVPSEWLDDDLLQYRIASRTVRVVENVGAVRDRVFYLDKSNSMGGGIAYRESPTEVKYVPKLSFAAALALAMAYNLRRLGAKAVVKLFDEEVHDPIVDLEEMIDVLLRIRWGRGTDINEVLYDALSYRGTDKRVVVITDGITEVGEEYVKRAKSYNLDIIFVFIKTDNQLLRQNFPCVHLQEAQPQVMLRI